MIAIRKLALIAVLSTGLTAFVRPATPVSTVGLPRHAHLEKSEPANNDTLARSPAAIRLWFSEKIELPVSSVKLANGAGAAIALKPLARPDTGEKAPVIASLQKPLAAGNYVVSWTAAAQDGHASTGKFEFTVKAAR
jgi:methionine-rich copper-binding protein CopC